MGTEVWDDADRARSRWRIASACAGAVSLIVGIAWDLQALLMGIGIVLLALAAVPRFMRVVYGLSIAGSVLYAVVVGIAWLMQPTSELPSAGAVLRGAAQFVAAILTFWAAGRLHPRRATAVPPGSIEEADE